MAGKLYRRSCLKARELHRGPPCLEASGWAPGLWDDFSGRCPHCPASGLSSAHAWRDHHSLGWSWGGGSEGKALAWQVQEAEFESLELCPPHTVWHIHACSIRTHRENRTKRSQPCFLGTVSSAAQAQLELYSVFSLGPKPGYHVLSTPSLKEESAIKGVTKGGNVRMEY